MATRSAGSRSVVAAPGPLLGRDTVSARILGHPALLLGGGRALLMQVAHPKVAAGVARHSEFREDPFGRLTRTMATMERIAFGSPATARSALRSLAARHRRVAGTTEDGLAYSAADPELVLWVHATLVDSVLAVDARYIGMLSCRDRIRFYDESRRLAAAFSVPRELVPPDLVAFRAYMEEATASLRVGPDARAIAASVVHPPAVNPLGPAAGLAAVAAGPLIEAVTADLLPPVLRSAYGLRPGAGLVPAALPVGPVVDLAAAVSRAVWPRVPRPLRRPGGLGRLTALLAA